MRIKTGADWELARRDVLKYLGVGVGCLPLLSASQAKGAVMASQRCLAIIHTSEGYRQQYWKPAAPGPLTTLPDSLTPLAKHQADLIVMPDLNNIGFGTGASGGHGSYGSIYYGLEPGKISYKEPHGNTFDQEIAAAIGPGKSGRPTLPLGVQLDLSPQSEPSQPASNHCFFLKGQPINPILDPYQVYMEIFAGLAPSQPMGGMMPSQADMAATQKLFLRKKSILDYVGKNLDAFKMRLGKQDQMAIDAHHDSVRELEDQLSSAGTPVATGATCSPPKGTMINIKDGSQYPAILDAHMSLAVAALACGVTRIIQLQLSDSSGNNINFAFVPGVPPKGTGYKTAFRNYHDLGHNPVLGGVDHKHIVDKWMMQQFATFIDRLKAVPTADGTLFGRTIALFGNHMQDGANHDGNHLPWISAGTCGGYFKTGVCLPDHQPTTGFMGEVCTAFGVKSPYQETLAAVRA
jgi:hypothetical protein